MRQSSPEMRVLAANLRKHRLVRGWSRPEVGKQVGMNPEVLKVYEMDPGKDIHLLPVIRLARLYGTTAEDLLTDPDPNLPPIIPAPKRGRPTKEKP